MLVSILLAIVVIEIFLIMVGIENLISIEKNHSFKLKCLIAFEMLEFKHILNKRFEEFEYYITSGMMKKDNGGKENEEKL